jgi:hypothetical protein
MLWSVKNTLAPLQTLGPSTGDLRVAMRLLSLALPLCALSPLDCTIINACGCECFLELLLARQLRLVAHYSGPNSSTLRQFLDLSSLFVA